MITVIQRVTRASVSIGGQLVSSIDKGLLVLLGVGTDDEEWDVTFLTEKIAKMRIFSGEGGKMNLSLAEIEGNALVVSQFTLYANTRKGNRPSFTDAARPEAAIPLYELFVTELEKLLGKKVQTGQFGADMAVELLNDGPVTIILNSKSDK